MFIKYISSPQFYTGINTATGHRRQNLLLIWMFMITRLTWYFLNEIASMTCPSWYGSTPMCAILVNANHVKCKPTIQWASNSVIVSLSVLRKVFFVAVILAPGFRSEDSQHFRKRRHFSSWQCRHFLFLFPLDTEYWLFAAGKICISQ